MSDVTVYLSVSRVGDGYLLSLRVGYDKIALSFCWVGHDCVISVLGVT